MTDSIQSKPLIKFAVRQDQHDLIRLASALTRTSMAEFARSAVNEKANNITEGFSQKRQRIRSA